MNLTPPFVTYTIKIKDIVDTGGMCQNFNVQWDDPTCGAINCYLNEDQTEIKVQVPEGCKDCFKVYISCADDCINCQVEEKVVCPCEDDSDCDGCSTCDQDKNYCITSCLDNEFCDDDLDICKECDDEHPCEGDKVCVNFKCECPPDRPYVNKDGDCIPCDPNDVPNCFICTKEGLIPKDCGDKVCDPETGDCVCCLGSGDVGPNEACVDKQCVCKPGFTRNVNGDCVPEPECETDSDCPDCEDCNKRGKCEPKSCPEGTVPVSDGNGGCDCKTPCENGTDCGNGEGCDGEYCQDCADQDCSTPDCDNLLGCGCNGNEQCVDIDSCGETPCDKPSDCKGENCTCYKGKCVDCANFDCTDCENIPGCDCVGSKGCVNVEEDCEDEINVVANEEDCDLIGTMLLKTECSCTPITAVFKVANPREEVANSLTVNFTVELRKGSATSINQAINLNRLDDTSKPNIADNDTPVSGSVIIRQTLRLQEIDPVTKQPLPEDAIDFDAYGAGHVLSFSNDDGFKELTGKKIYKEGAEFEISGSLYVIEKVELSAVQNNDFDFTGRSGCVYDAENTIIDREITSSLFNAVAGGTVSGLRAFKSLFSADTRNPLLSWFRADPDASSYDMNSDFIRKTYMPGVANLHEDILYGPDEIPDGVKQKLDPSEGELYTGYKYAFKSDCSCDDDFFDYGTVGFCQPETFGADFVDCGKEFQIVPFDVCDVNQDLDQFRLTPGDAQVWFDLYIDGTKEGSYRHRQNGGIKSDEGKSLFRSITRNRAIGYITLVQRTQGGYEVCTRTRHADNFDTPQVEISDPICGAGANGSIEIAQNNNGYVISNVTSSNANVTFANGVYTLTAPKGDSFHYIVYYENGCIVEGEVTPDFCESCYDISVTAESVVEGDPLTFDIVVNNGEAPFDYTISKSGSVKKTGTMTNAVESVSIDSPTSGTYTITVVDANGCSATTDVQTNVMAQPSLVFSAPAFCEGDNAVFTISGVPSDLLGATLNYSRTVNGVTTSGLSVELNGSIVPITVNTPNGDIVYELGTLVKDGLELLDFGSESHTNEMIPEGSVDSFVLEDSNICVGSNAVVNITGTPNGLVRLTNGDTVLLDGNGEGQYVKSGLSIGYHTFTIDEVEMERGSTGDVCLTDISSVDATIVVSAGPAMITSTECESENPTAKKYLYFSVSEAPSQSGSQFTAEDIANSNAPLTVNYLQADVNNTGYYKYEVIVPENSSTDSVRGTYVANNGNCEVSEVVSVPSCEYPPMEIILADPANGCETPEAGIVLNVDSVRVDGSAQPQQDMQATFYDGNNVIRAQGPLNFTYEPGPGVYSNLSVKVTFVNEPYEGLEQTASFPTAEVETVDFNIIDMNGGSVPSEIAVGQSLTLGSDYSGGVTSYAWTILRNGSAYETATTPTYTFSPADSATYEISLKIINNNGCENTESLTVVVVNNLCSVQYAEVSGPTNIDSITDTEGNTITFGSTPLACYGSGPTANDNLASKIKTAIGTLGYNTSNVEVFWQYMDDGCNVRIYVFNAPVSLQNIGSTLVTRECTSGEAPGCDDPNADNYNSDLNNNSTISITNDGTECFSEPEVLECNQMIVEGNGGYLKRLHFNNTPGDFEIQSVDALGNPGEGKGDVAVSQSHGLFAVGFPDGNIYWFNEATSNWDTVGTVSESSVGCVFLDDDTFVYVSIDGERWYTVDVSNFSPGGSLPAAVQTIDFATYSSESEVQALLDYPATNPGDISQLNGKVYFNKGLKLYRFGMTASNGYDLTTLEYLGDQPNPSGVSSYDALGICNVKGSLIFGGATGTPALDTDKLYRFIGDLNVPADIEDVNKYEVLNQGGSPWSLSVTIYGLASLEDSGVSC